MEQLNVFGEPLPICCEDPMTGFTRSGACETMDQDHGMHTVCVLQDGLKLMKQTAPQRFT